MPTDIYWEFRGKKKKLCVAWKSSCSVCVCVHTHRHQWVYVCLPCSAPPSDSSCAGAHPSFLLFRWHVPEEQSLDSSDTELQLYVQGHSVGPAWLEKTLRLFRGGGLELPVRSGVNWQQKQWWHCLCSSWFIGLYAELGESWGGMAF